MKRYSVIAGALLWWSLGFGNWEVQFDNRVYGLYGISFVDTLHGWAVGGGLTYGPGKILRTTDGGNTWDWLPFETAQILNGVCFVDSLQGWAVGDSGTIIHTDNGGDTWMFQSADTTADFEKTTFVDRDTGWAIGQWSGILHTTNGGDTWVRQIAPQGPHDICFVDASSGWIASSDGTVLHTSNGGANWEVQETGVPGSPRDCRSISFVDTLNGWVTAWGHRTSGPERWILHTADGGNTWTIQDSTIGNGEICFVDENNGWTAYNGSEMWHTTDGGTTWDFSGTIVGPAIIVELIFTDINHGWGVASIAIVENRAAGWIIHYEGSSWVEEKTRSDLSRNGELQICPNPFAGNTTIRYAVPRKEKVSLSIYNASGRCVKTLVNAVKRPGYHNVQLETNDLAGGIYFVKFVANDHKKVKKLILVR